MVTDYLNRTMVLYTWDELMMSISQVGKPLRKVELALSSF